MSIYTGHGDINGPRRKRRAPMASHLGKSRAIGERRHPVPTPSNPEPLSAEELLAFLRQHWPRLTLAEVIAMLKAHGFELPAPASDSKLTGTA